MGSAGAFGHLPGVRPSCGDWHSDRHCTWGLDVETLPLATLPLRVLLFCLLLCLPCWVGFALAPCGRAGVGVWVCVGVCVCGVRVGACVSVPAGLRCRLESRFLHVPIF